MNYQNHYDRLIDRARNRNLEGYCERHHVIPKCLGGDNSKNNIVRLTAEEHYVAHQLLVKMNPGHSGIANAAVYMGKRATGNKAYGWLRRRMAEAMRGHHRARGYKHTPEAIAKMSAASKGRKLSPEHKAKVGAASRGRKMPERSEEYRAKIAAANRRRLITEQHRANTTAAMRKRALDPVFASRMALINVGRKQSPEVIANRVAKSAETRRLKWAST